MPDRERGLGLVAEAMGSERAPLEETWRRARGRAFFLRAWASFDTDSHERHW
jgi:hypothetical protein